MKRSYLYLLAALQAAVLAFLILAITQKSLAWHVVAAVSVSLLTLFAVYIVLKQLMGSDSKE